MTAEEAAALRFQNGTSSESGKGGRRYSPYVFTEQGVAMLSSILNSDRAVQVNIAIMRAFVQMRELAVSNRAMTRRLDDLERKYDSQFKIVFDALREMMEPQPKKTKKIGSNKYAKVAEVFPSRLMGPGVHMLITLAVAGAIRNSNGQASPGWLEG